MGVQCCLCLNVKVHCTDTTAAAESELPKLDGFGRQVVLGLAGIHVEHARVVRIVQIAHENIKLSVLHCANCNNDVLAAILQRNLTKSEQVSTLNEEDALFADFVAHRGRFLLHDSSITSAEADTVRLSPAYSDIFRVVINEEHTKQLTQLKDLSINSEFNNILRSLDETIKIVFTQKEIEMQEHIRKFVEEQRKQHDEELSRAQQARHKLWNSICFVNYDRLVNQKLAVSNLEGVSQPKAAAAISSEPKAVVDLNGSKPDSNDIPKDAENESDSAAKPKVLSTLTIAVNGAPTSKVRRTYSADSRDPANLGSRSRGDSDIPQGVFTLEGFEDTDKTPFIDEFDDTEADETEEADSRASSTSISSIRAPPPSLASSIYSSSLPVDIPRGLQSRPTFNQSAIQNALQPDPTAATPVVVNIEAVSEPTFDDDDDSEKFVAPHQLAARTFVDETSVLFGERPRPPITKDFTETGL